MRKKIFFLIVILLILSLFNNKIVVEAKTNYIYNVSFNYSLVYIVNTESKEISSGENVSDINILDSYGSSTSLSISLKGNKEHKNNIIENNSYISSSEIEIIINANYENYEIYLYDSFNNVIATSGTNTIYIDELVDDNYKLIALLSGRGNLIDNRTYEMYKTTCEFNFSVDTQPPIIEGASLYMNGMYVNSSFDIKAIDKGSGVKKLYMLEPGGLKYQEIDINSNISLSKNGLITFYAYDNAGNISNLYYVYNDIEKPTGCIYSVNNETINNSYTDLSFYYQGYDSNSKIDYMLYKTPNNTEFSIYDGQIINNTYSEGYYEFKSVDKCGNESDITKIYLYQNVNPVKIRTIENSNKVYLTWENNNYIVLLNNQDYIKNTLITQEGEYVVKIENEIGIIYYISFSISCYYEFSLQKEANCIEEGYKLYNCISCSNYKKIDIVSKGPHNYTYKDVKPTCTTNGGILYYCIYCNDNFLTQIKQKKGHAFISFISTPVTCTENGERLYICESCGYEKYEEVIMKGHNFTYLEDIKDQDEKLRLLRCTECKTIEVERLVINNEKIQNVISNIIDTYFKYIVLIFIITSSIWSLCIGISYIIKTKKEEQISNKKVLINYLLGIVIIFIIILAIPYLIDGIFKILL